MSNAAEIIAVVAAGGAVGYLLWKRSSAAAPAPDACAGLSGDALIACKAAGILGGVVGAVAGAVTTNPARAFADERATRKANNDKLNGPPDSTFDVDVRGGSSDGAWDPAGPASAWANVNPVSSSPGRYANGCEPYYAAPGWSKCAAGTLDMYEQAVQQGSGGGISNPSLYNEGRAAVGAVFETPADLAQATADHQKAHDNGDDSHWYQVELGAGYSPRPIEKLNKDHYGTGASGDPITQGPWVDGAGKIWFLVRGKRIQAPAGQVPLAIAMRARGPLHTGDTQATVDAAIKALTDAQAVSLIPVGSYGRSSGTGTTTNYTGCAAIVANPNLTWDPATSSWKRLSVGQKRNLGPCASARGHATTIGVGGGTSITLGLHGWDNTTP